MRSSVGITLSILIIVVICQFIQAQVQQQSQQLSPLLLVVGDVTHNSVRILYENLLPRRRISSNNNSASATTTTIASSRQLHLTATIKPVEEKDGFKQQQQQTIIATDRPQILVFQSLAENVLYQVTFESVESDNNFIRADDSTLPRVTFRTLSLKDDLSSQQKYKIAVVACDRSYEDNDDQMWKQIARDESDRIGMVHLGDQIYADQIAKQIVSWKRDGVQLPSFDNLVDMFRDVYRRTWGHPSAQNVLRHGAHWMIPDDHDIINNLDRQVYQNATEMVLAGQRAFYEYQFQLHSDLTLENNDVNSNAVSTGQNYHHNHPVYFSKQFLDTCLLFLDFRFEKTFAYDAENPLLGAKQYQWLRQQLDTCAQHSKLTLVFSSTPILFLSQTMSNVVYMAEKERYSTHPDLVHDTIKLLNMLGDFKVQNPRKNIKLIGGDVHQFFTSRICNMSAIPVCLDQMVTSGVTRGSTVIHEVKLLLFYLINRYFQTPTAGSWYLEQQVNQAGQPLQQYLGTNYGLLTIDTSDRTGYKFLWEGVANKNSTANEQVVMELYNSFPIIKPFVILLIVGLTALPIALITLCCQKMKKRKTTAVSQRKKEQ